MDDWRRKGIGVTGCRCVGVVVSLRNREEITDGWMIGWLEKRECRRDGGLMNRSKKVAGNNFTF